MDELRREIRLCSENRIVGQLLGEKSDHGAWEYWLLFMARRLSCHWTLYRELLKDLVYASLPVLIVLRHGSDSGALHKRNTHQRAVHALQMT